MRYTHPCRIEGYAFRDFNFTKLAWGLGNDERWGEFTKLIRQISRGTERAEDKKANERRGTRQRPRPRFANSNFQVSSASRETVIILAGMSRLITIARTYGPA